MIKKASLPLSRENIWIILLLFLYILWSTLFLTPVPQWDDYDAILRFLNEYIENPSFGSRISLIFQQHNEHRLVLSNLLYVGFWSTFGFIDLRIFQMIGDLGWILLALFLIKQIRDSRLKVMSLFLLLSLRPIQLFFFPMAALQQYYQIFFSVLCVYYFSKIELEKNAMIKSFSCLTMSVLSGGGWLALSALPVLRVYWHKKITKVEIFFGLFFLACMAYYFILIHYIPPAEHPKVLLSLTNPLRLLGYLLAYLGNIFENILLAVSLGLIILFLFFKILKRGPSFNGYLIFFIFVTALITALNRSPMGLYQALSTRYTIYSITLCVSLITAFEGTILNKRKYFLVLWWICFIFYVDSTIKGIKDMAGHRQDLRDRKIIYDDVHPEVAIAILKKSQNLGVCRCEITGNLLH